MENKHMAVAFTGHRPETIPYINDFNSSQYFALEKAIWQEVHRCINAGYSTFYCGAARGSDMLCGEIIKEEIETKFPAWVKQVEILSAQIFSANIGIAHWKREAAEAKRSSREANDQMGKMKVEVMSLYSQVSDLQKYVKYMPPEVKQQYMDAREKAMRMLRSDYER